MLKPAAHLLAGVCNLVWRDAAIRHRCGGAAVGRHLPSRAVRHVGVCCQSRCSSSCCILLPHCERRLCLLDRLLPRCQASLCFLHCGGAGSDVRICRLQLLLVRL